ncbi:MAG: sensor histidine kinase, partial [Gaiellales bacterium]
SPVSLDDVLVEPHHEARSLAPEVRVLLRLNDQATVVGDRDKLHQLVRNLLDNALRHTPPDGEVRLELRRVDGTAEVIVADTGRGITAAQLPHVFERRYQGAPEERSGGAGLGLSIALEIARAHGGSIAVDSREGHGTSVRVTLPIAPAEVSSDRYSPLTSASPEPPSLKVPR